MSESNSNRLKQRPTVLNVIGNCVEGVLRWQAGVGAMVSIVLLWIATTGSVCGGNFNKAKSARARGDLGFIAEQVRQFRMEQERFPVALSELVERPGDAKAWPEGGYLDRLPRDPWGESYFLVRPGRRCGDFEVISLGADNQPGGEGFDADLDQGSGRP
jgi:general secretion pathway protein G